MTSVPCYRQEIVATMQTSFVCVCGAFNKRPIAMTALYYPIEFNNKKKQFYDRSHGSQCKILENFFWPKLVLYM
jgi:hypothetical protein